MKQALVKQKKNRPERVFILVSLIPCIAWYFTFFGIPIVYSLYLSFWNWGVAGPTKFVGLSHYIQIITEDKIFYRSVLNSAYFTVGIIIFGMLLSFIIALLINSLGTGAATIFKTLYFLPVISSMVAVAVLWRWLYQPKFGLINQGLKLFGVSPIMWLESPNTAMPSIIIMSVWKMLGFNIVLFLAGLSSIPESLYESAIINGANGFQKVRYITIPLLRPTIIFMLVTGTIFGLQAFDQIYILTQGGPVNATRTIVYHLYLKAFDFFKMGNAAAIAFLLFLLIIALALTQLRLMNTEWEY